MTIKSEDLIRIYLRERDGATTGEICRDLEISQSLTVATLKAMPDTYIDRWTNQKTKEGEETTGYIAVWAIVVPPENCPKPIKNADDNR